MKKTLAGLGIAAALSCAAAFTAFAGWGQDETGYYYQFDSGARARDQIVESEGARYAFDAQGYMVTGWFKNSYSDWYFCAPEQGGAIVTGWRQIDNVWYYFDPGRQGAMHKSWLDEKDKRYYFDESGAMVTGVFSIGDDVYFAEPTGELRRGITERIAEAGKMIRYDANGKQWYRNEENEINHQTGGELWLPVRPGEDLARQRAVVQEDNRNEAQNRKDELYKEYKEQVATAPTYKARTKRTEKWEARVKKVLGKWAVSAEETEEYITQVKSNRYNPDDIDKYTDDSDDYDDDYYDDED